MGEKSHLHIYRDPARLAMLVLYATLDPIGVVAERRDTYGWLTNSNCHQTRFNISLD